MTIEKRKNRHTSRRPGLPPFRTCPARSRHHGLGYLQFAFLLGALFLTACNDPYSQRRIERRWAHFNQTATDIGDREADGVRRVREADETLKKWWKRDCEDFERKVPTIGDYFW